MRAKLWSFCTGLGRLKNQNNSILKSVQAAHLRAIAAVPYRMYLVPNPGGLGNGLLLFGLAGRWPAATSTGTGCWERHTSWPSKSARQFQQNAHLARRCSFPVPRLVDVSV
jgi:hypothetical protein